MWTFSYNERCSAWTLRMETSCRFCGWTSKSYQRWTSYVWIFYQLDPWRDFDQMFTWYVLQCLATVNTREKPSHGICWGSKMCCTVPCLRERDDGHQNVTTYTLQTQWWWSSKWDNLHIANRDQLWCTVRLPQNLAVQLWEQDDAAIWLNAQWAMLTVALVAENVHSCTCGWKCSQMHLWLKMFTVALVAENVQSCTCGWKCSQLHL